jgi:hypothetical protein
VSKREAAVDSLEEAINRALKSAQRNGTLFGEKEALLLKRLDEKTRTLGIDNADPRRETLALTACRHADNVLRASNRPQPVHLDGLVNVLTSMDYGGGYVAAIKVQLSTYLALLADLAEKPTVARQAAEKATHGAKGLDDLTRGTTWLVRGEVSVGVDQDRPLRRALGFFKRVPNNAQALLMELRTRDRLIDHYNHFGRTFRSTWHTWRIGGIRKRLMNDFRYQSRELKNARTNRVPPTLGSI